MTAIQYFVVNRFGLWRITVGETLYGPYPTLAAAIRVAIDAAQKAGIEGRGASVLAPDMSGRLRVQWTYGLDAYPPVG